jgi:hypothetical protein
MPANSKPAASFLKLAVGRGSRRGRISPKRKPSIALACHFSAFARPQEQKGDKTMTTEKDDVGSAETLRDIRDLIESARSAAIEA